MDHRDALAPLIELVGVFAGSAASPLTAAAILILALCLSRYSLYLMLAAAVGMSDGAFGEVTGVTTVGLIFGTLIGAAATLLQAWCVWPVVSAMKSIGGAIVRRFGPD
ncbi:hypothetical protein GGE65_000253 [Skermanella aerolata]|jgi:hypothetical protein|uniref:Uncharacterized protein n=1 Tax=Skermanella aerolata TaxID=393310 RepID=A0A512DHL7_9PROT|nr:hypothetical protein [Skermanella aerolata]KJB94012.1 hypothetical protein N826_19855 [Skermanella aerolata KACC 11604]GEO35967.1 hypothetical protein SAE02_01150 [Skermanella aerolata]